LAINRHLQLRRSYAEVERIVAQRTRELERANQELLHSQKMKALGTLAAGIAHDFNSILSIIKGSAQIIGDHLDDPDKVRTRLARILGMVDQGSGIVKAMLGLSRSGALEAKSCDLNLLVIETIRALGDQLPRELTLKFDPPRDLPPLRLLPDLVRQVLINLILNAVDALGGRGVIELAVGRVASLPPDLILPPAPADRFVSVSVTDSGPGIAPDVLPRIFEPFFTTKAFSTRRGTGLGLTMVYEIARETGLGLRVESIPGQGSTFTILLPVADAPAKGTPAEDKPAEGGS
jgi:signal transduction histidine kinase